MKMFENHYFISVTGLGVDLACGVIMVVCVGYTTIVRKNGQIALIIAHYVIYDIKLVPHAKHFF